MKLVSAIFFILYLCTAAQPAKDLTKGPLDLIEKTCAQTNYKDLCITSLTSDPNSYPADKTELALVALRLASSNASDISESIKVMLNDSSLNNQVMMQQALFDCLDDYLDASLQLDDAISALLIKAYGDVNKWIKAAIADIRTCGSEFGRVPPLLEQRNEVFIKICEIATVICKIAEAP